MSKPVQLNYKGINRQCYSVKTTTRLKTGFQSNINYLMRNTETKNTTESIVNKNELNLIVALVFKIQ